jgi:hypothetical protein
MSETVVIERRFCGPPDSGNGGYVCGRVAALMEGPATVRLHVPPPLEEALTVEREGPRVRLLRADGTVVAEGRPGTPSVEPPEPPLFDEAEAAAKKYRGFEEHTFPTCFVCGPAREPGDGLRIFAGPIEGRKLVAAPWIPDPSLDDGEGRVSPEFVWAALDCPSGFAVLESPGKAVVLGELTAELRGPVTIGERCVAAGWAISSEGRKHCTGSALFGPEGDCRALAEAIWFEVAVDALSA